MSRLYINVDSDQRQRTTGIRLQQNGYISARWGSRSNSQELFTVRINWDKGQDAPTVTLQTIDPRANYEGFDKLERS